MKGFLIFLFLLLIPTQLGRHFWPDWSYVLGIRIDYLSPTLYLLDIVWLIGLIFNLIKPSALRVSLPSPGYLWTLTGRLSKIFSFKNFLIIGFVAINILMAASPVLAIYKWLRIGQIYLTWIYFRKNKELIKEKLIKIIPIWIIFESLLAVAQISKDGSLGGIFYWLGERAFNFNTIGIAQMSVFGEGVIRAYGTFSHPNSLAGFLLVSLIIFYWIKPSALRASLPSSGYLWTLTGRLLWWVVFWLGLVGILVSGSRTIWVLALILVLIMVIKNIRNKKNIIGFGLLFLVMIIFVLKMVSIEYQFSDFLGGWDKDGINKRIQLNVAGLKMIESSPWFGVGAGNFLTRLPEFQKNNGIFWLQPVHNILLLILSEVGFLGLGLLIFNLKFLIFNQKKINKFFYLTLGVILISGMIDHYWLTLPQNVWLLVLVLGIV